MLLRGQNIVQYAHFPDDVVTAFIQCSVKHGMNIFRIFDALNDTRNMALRNPRSQSCWCDCPWYHLLYQQPGPHHRKIYRNGRRAGKMGADAIVLKDMAGLIPPAQASTIIGGLKARLSIPVWIHTHDTAGLGAGTYMAAIDAGSTPLTFRLHPSQTALAARYY